MWVWKCWKMLENVGKCRPAGLKSLLVSKEQLRMKGCEAKRVPFSIFAKATQHAANLENLVPRHGENACRINSSMYSITGAADSPSLGGENSWPDAIPIPGATFISLLPLDNCNKCFCCLLLRVGRLKGFSLAFKRTSIRYKNFI